MNIDVDHNLGGDVLIISFSDVSFWCLMQIDRTMLQTTLNVLTGDTVITEDICISGNHGNNRTWIGTAEEKYITMSMGDCDGRHTTVLLDEKSKLTICDMLLNK
jgi:hypothetical protein